MQIYGKKKYPTRKNTNQINSRSTIDDSYLKECNMKQENRLKFFFLIFIFDIDGLCVIKIDGR